MIKKEENPHITKNKVLEFLEDEYEGFVTIYTDGSKDPNTGKTGFAYYIPSENITKFKRTSDNISVYTTEMAAITNALTWLCSKNYTNQNLVILTDSYSSLQSIKSNSSSRPDLLQTIQVLADFLRKKGNKLIIEYIPAHIGIPGNEICDKLAKKALKQENVECTIGLSSNEFISIIKNKFKKKQQENWENTSFWHNRSIQ